MAIRTAPLTTTAAVALLASSVTTAQAQLEVTISGQVAFSSGYWDEGSADDFADFEMDSEVVFSSRGVADNGLEYGARIEINTSTKTEDSADEAEVILRGSWGSLTFDEAHNEPECGTRAVDNFWTYGAFGTIANDRDEFATENDTNTEIVNPAFVVDNTLKGFSGQFGLSFCADIWNLPSYFSIAGDYGSYSGESHGTNIALPEGLGITGNGVTPGVFINSPTDITSYDFDAIRDVARVTFQIDQVVLSKGRIPPSSGDTRPPIWWSNLSIIGGVSSGTLRQEERGHFNASTPAFGAGSASVIDTHTLYEGIFGATYAGLSVDLQHPIAPNLSFIAGIDGTVGFGFYDIEMRDSITATGLGGALNYTSASTNSYGLVTPTATATLSAGVAGERFRFIGFIGVEAGTDPWLNMNRVDSIGGVAAPPKLSLGFTPNFNLGTTFSVYW